MTFSPFSAVEPALSCGALSDSMSAEASGRSCFEHLSQIDTHSGHPKAAK
jgi:hypothetical protein